MNLKLNRYFWKHPEAKENEVCLGNFLLKHYDLIGWKTKRRGFIAFDIDGGPVKNHDLFPVFADRRELEAAGLFVRGYRVDTVATFIFKGQDIFTVRQD